jgi:hypothetical protein
MDKHLHRVVFTDTFPHRHQIRLDGVESIDDCAQMPFEPIHSGPQTFPIVGVWFGEFWWATSMQNRGDVLRMPAQRSGKRLQRPCASASLNDVMLDFADGRPRNMRTFCKLTLSPAEFIHPRVDHLGDGRPVLYRFLRAPPRRRD